MAVNFPDSPSVNDTFTSGTRTYQYDGTSWRLFSSTLALPSADLIPPGNEEQDLGSPTNRYRDLYLSSNSLHLGDTIVSTTAEGTLQTEIDGQVVDVGGGGAGGVSTKTYVHEGLLRVSNGSERIYINSSTTLTQIDGFVQVPPAGDDIVIRINKNGTQASTFTISDGTTSTLAVSVSISLVAGDFITIDITSVGSSIPGSDLQLILTI